MSKNSWSYAIIMIVSLVILTACDFQSKLLYYPNKQQPSRSSLSAGNMQFWPTNIEGYRGLVSQPKSKIIKGTIIVFHGNAGTAVDRIFYVKALTSLGYRVILAEYPCYGAREGKVGERPFVRDALETLGLAYQHYGGPFFLIGESLGCGVAAAVAKETPVKIDGIILITPWDTLLSVAKAKFPWFPLGLLMKDKYNTIENLKGYHGRIAVIAAERDTVIPMTHAASLYQSLTGCKAMWVIDGAGHNDWPMHVNDTWWHEIIGFVDGPLRL